MSEDDQIAASRCDWHLNLNSDECLSPYLTIPDSGFTFREPDTLNFGQYTISSESVLVPQPSGDHYLGLQKHYWSYDGHAAQHSQQRELPQLYTGPRTEGFQAHMVNTIEGLMPQTPTCLVSSPVHCYVSVEEALKEENRRAAAESLTRTKEEEKALNDRHVKLGMAN
ncbi:hypothetical protein PG985_005517 [Apiospora marii]|uniref:uncharacterized protein n=1 Tax=Apiospora marii TaxID=335849 RepID=UPI00312ECF96